MNPFEAKGREASRLRRRKYGLIRRYGLPENAVGGSLSCTHRKCGKATCHCAEGDGHPIWLLTYRLDGRKTNVVIPSSVVPALAPFVEEAQELRDAVNELVHINAQLVQLWRQEQRVKDARERAKASNRKKAPKRKK